MNTAIAIAQIVIGALIITLILLQQRDSDMSGFLGGSSGGGSGFYQQRRGLERFFFGATIVLVILFAGLSLVSRFYAPENTAPAAVTELPAASSTPATE